FYRWTQDERDWERLAAISVRDLEEFKIALTMLIRRRETGRFVASKADLTILYALHRAGPRALENGEIVEKAKTLWQAKALGPRGTRGRTDRISILEKAGLVTRPEGTERQGVGITADGSALLVKTGLVEPKPASA